jgi:phosphopantothenoylcysteine decarboxylase / phosphopantothenate---cysteine ligase
MLKNKILLKISGSIAVYKSAYLVSKLVQSGYLVKVVMSDSATKFVGKATFEGLTGNKVFTDSFEDGEMMNHINLVKWANLVILAPATANTINKFASGDGGNLITSLFLAHDWSVPYLIAPAMNTKMYLHPATQNSLKILKDWGVKVLDSDSGYLACGDEGVGKLLDPEKIFSEIEKTLKPQKKDISVLITSGGTKENIDNVRFIANMSTGNTGASITDYLFSEGYNLTFLYAKGSIKPEAKCNMVEYISFNDLNREIEQQLSQNHFDVVIHLAAVSDYSVSEIRTQKEKYILPLTKKIKSDEDSIKISMKKNLKIIDRIKSYSNNKNVVLFGFKLVSGNIESEKIDSVNSLFNSADTDFIVLNDFANRSQSIQSSFRIFEKYNELSNADSILDLSKVINNLILTKYETE